MMPRERASLVAAAKSAAVPVASCVAARVPPDHLLQDRTWQELAALVIVLAEAADPVRLRAIAEAGEDGRQHVSEEALREAHRLHSSMRLAGETIPPRLAAQERAYQRWRKDVQRQEREEAA